MALGSDAARYWKLFAVVSQLTMGGILLGTGLAYLAKYQWNLHWSFSLVFFFIPVLASFKALIQRVRALEDQSASGEDSESSENQKMGRQDNDSP